MYKYNTLFLNSTYLIRIISPSVHFYLDSEVSVGRFHLECGIEIVLLPGHGRGVVHLSAVGIIFSVEVDAHPVVQLVGSALPVHHARADAHVEQGEDGTVSLEILWKNGSDKTVFFDSRYTVAKKRKTDYMLCTEKTNFTFPPTYCGLQPGEEAQRTYRITDFYDLTEAGVYLFSAECQVVLVPERGILRPSTVHVEFTIS